MIKNRKVGNFGLSSEAPTERKGRKEDKDPKNSIINNHVILRESFTPQSVIAMKYPLGKYHLFGGFLSA